MPCAPEPGKPEEMRESIFVGWGEGDRRAGCGRIGEASDWFESMIHCRLQQEIELAKAVIRSNNEAFYLSYPLATTVAITKNKLLIFPSKNKTNRL